MKNTKYIILLLVITILLLIGFIIGKGFFVQNSEKQAELEYERNRQLSNQQGHESAVRIHEAFKNLNKTR